MTARISDRAKEKIFDILERQDRTNRDHGKLEFRNKIDTLAKKSRYGPTSVKRALADLRAEGRIETRRTGRSSLFTMPLSTHPVRGMAKESATAADGHIVPIRKPEFDHRNKVALKNSLVGEESSTTDTSSTSKPTTNQTLSEADDLCLDFVIENDASVRFQGQPFAEKHGIKHLRAQLEPFHGQRGVRIGIDEKNPAKLVDVRQRLERG